MMKVTVQLKLVLLLTSQHPPCLMLNAHVLGFWNRLFSIPPESRPLELHRFAFGRFRKQPLAHNGISVTETVQELTNVFIQVA